MKRAICICLLSSIVLTGCVSKADYEQLEERVSRLEQEQSRINESTTTTSKTSTVADPSISESDTEASNQESSTNYSLEGLSAEEIYAELQSIYQTLSGCSGMTKEEYMLLFNDSPDNSNFQYFRFEGYYDSTISDCIDEICPEGIYEQMDGTVDRQETLWVQIDLCISDYETAVDFYNLFVSNEKYKENMLSNSQDGTNWVAVAIFEQYCFTLIEMRKIDNGYYFIIRDYLT